MLPRTAHRSGVLRPQRSRSVLQAHIIQAPGVEVQLLFHGSQQIPDVPSAPAHCSRGDPRERALAKRGAVNIDGETSPGAWGETWSAFSIGINCRDACGPKVSAAARRTRVPFARSAGAAIEGARDHVRVWRAQLCVCYWCARQGRTSRSRVSSVFACPAPGASAIDLRAINTAASRAQQLGFPSLDDHSPARHTPTKTRTKTRTGNRAVSARMDRSPP